MKSRWGIIAVAAVVVVLIMGYLVWRNSYLNDVAREWASLQKCTAELDGKIATGGCDFSDIKEKSGSLKSIVETTKKRFSVTTVPPGKAATNFYFVDYLDKTILALDSICINCDTWSAAEMSKLKQHTEEMRNAQLECANRIGRSGNNQLFISTATTLNRMHDKRSPKVASTTGTIVITSSSSPSFSVPTDPAAANYFTQMRSLLSQYKALRNDLEQSGVSGRAKYASGAVSYDDRLTLENARDNRQAILNQINGIAIPYGCQNIHDTATDAVFNGISAINDLLACNWDGFHQKSNNGKAGRAYHAFGLEG